MLVKTKAIVISSLRYQEKSLIVKCFTESDGLKSYFVPSAYSGKKSNQKIAYFQPLTILEIEANHKNKGTLEQLKEIEVETYLPTLTITRQWKDRKKKVVEALFKSYLFIFGDEVDRNRAVTRDAVVKSIFFNGKPAVIHQEEINNLKAKIVIMIYFIQSL